MLNRPEVEAISCSLSYSISVFANVHISNPLLKHHLKYVHLFPITHCLSTPSMCVFTYIITALSSTGFVAIQRKDTSNFRIQYEAVWLDSPKWPSWWDSGARKISIVKKKLSNYLALSKLTTSNNFKFLHITSSFPFVVVLGIDPRVASCKSNTPLLSTIHFTSRFMVDVNCTGPQSTHALNNILKISLVFKFPSDVRRYHFINTFPDNEEELISPFSGSVISWCSNVSYAQHL